MAGYKLWRQDKGLTTSIIKQVIIGRPEIRSLSSRQILSSRLRVSFRIRDTASSSGSTRYFIRGMRRGLDAGLQLT